MLLFLTGTRRKHNNQTTACPCLSHKHGCRASTKQSLKSEFARPGNFLINHKQLTGPGKLPGVWTKQHQNTCLSNVCSQTVQGSNEFILDIWCHLFVHILTKPTWWLCFLPCTDLHVGVEPSWSAFSPTGDLPVTSRCPWQHRDYIGAF